MENQKQIIEMQNSASKKSESIEQMLLNKQAQRDARFTETENIALQIDNIDKQELPKSSKIISSNVKSPGSVDEDVRIKLPSEESSSSKSPNQNLQFGGNTKDLTESNISSQPNTSSHQENQIL